MPRPRFACVRGVQPGRKTEAVHGNRAERSPRQCCLLGRFCRETKLERLTDACFPGHVGGGSQE